MRENLLMVRRIHGLLMLFCAAILIFEISPSPTASYDTALRTLHTLEGPIDWNEIIPADSAGTVFTQWRGNEIDRNFPGMLSPENSAVFTLAARLREAAVGRPNILILNPRKYYDQIPQAAANFLSVPIQRRPRLPREFARFLTENPRLRLVSPGHISFGEKPERFQEGLGCSLDRVCYVLPTQGWYRGIFTGQDTSQSYELYILVWSAGEAVRHQRKLLIPAVVREATTRFGDLSQVSASRLQELALEGVTESNASTSQPDTTIVTLEPFWSQIKDLPVREAITLIEEERHKVERSVGFGGLSLNEHAAIVISPVVLISLLLSLGLHAKHVRELLAVKNVKEIYEFPFALLFPGWYGALFVVATTLIIPMAVGSYLIDKIPERTEHNFSFSYAVLPLFTMYGALFFGWRAAREFFFLRTISYAASHRNSVAALALAKRPVLRGKGHIAVAVGVWIIGLLILVVNVPVIVSEYVDTRDLYDMGVVAQFLKFIGSLGVVTVVIVLYVFAHTRTWILRRPWRSRAVQRRL
jgi:hypothetical protein